MGEISLRLVAGAPEALETALAAEVVERQKADPLAPVAVLIGGTLQRPYLQRRLADLCDGIVNVHFLTQSELALALGEKQLTLDGRRPLPPLADRILLHEIASEHEGYFAPVRDTPGFADSLFQVVRELRGAGYDADSFAKSIKGACEAKGKDAALANLFSRFLDRRVGFYGPDDCLLEANTTELPFTALAIHGFWDPPDALRSVLARLAEQIPVTAYLPQTGTGADEVHANFRAWLEGNGVAAEALEEPAMPSSTLAGAKANIFDDPAAADKAPDPDGSIRLISGPDPHREVREVARTVLAWARDGVRFHEIAIAYRHADIYRPVIEAVFGEANIPIYLHEGTPLAERPVGRRALALIDLVSSNLERRAVMDFLTDADLPTATRKAFGVSAPRWDKTSRDAGVVEGFDQWNDRLAAYRDELAGSDRDWLRKRGDDADALRRFVADLAGALADHEDEAPWGTHLVALEKLLRRYLFEPDAVLDPLQGLARFDALGGTTTYHRFLEVVRGAIETLRSEDVLGRRPGAFARRGVNVIDVNSLRGLSFRAVAIVGLAERSFPPAPRQTPLLLDEERERLTEKGGRRVPTRATGPDAEPMQFALAISAARERLILSYPRKSTEGRPQLPSYFFRAAAEAVVGERVPTDEVKRLPEALYSRSKGGRIGALELADALSPSERDRTLVETDRFLGRAILSEAEPRLGWAFTARDARASSKLTAYDGLIAGDAERQLAKILDGPFSPSALETYAGCPHRYLLGNVLGLRKNEEPEATVRISALDKGSLLHLILERFLTESPTKGEELVYGDGEEDRLLTITDEEFSAAEERGEAGYPLTWRYETEEMREDLTRWLESERGGTNPALRDLPEGDYEIRFGYSGGDGDTSRLSRDEPLQITDQGVELQVAGRIDRMNWNKETKRFQVVDYKTGGVNKDLKDGGMLLGGRALQLPLYLLVGAELTGIDPAHGSAEYHYSTRRGQFARHAFTGEKLDERREQFSELITGVVTAIRGGAFQRAPVTERDCTWCDFDRVCPTARHSQIRAKERTHVATRFAKLREIE